jgi:hypothetical protein
MERDDARRYTANLQGELESASLYRALADSETDPHLSEVYAGWQASKKRMPISGASNWDESRPTAAPFF